MPRTRPCWSASAPTWPSCAWPRRTPAPATPSDAPGRDAPASHLRFHGWMTMEKSPARVLGVTAALLACGAVFGALAAVVAAAVAFNITDGPPFSLYAEIYVIAAVVGAAMGGVLLPAACWLLLRRVPLGLAFLGTVL